MTKIEYADVTVNDQAGCSAVTQGCVNCFARRMSHRLACMGQEKYQGVIKNGMWTGKINLWPQAQDAVLKMKKPRRIFWNDMSDPFHPDVPYSHTDRKMAVIALTPQHFHMIFTKQPERMCEYFNYNAGPAWADCTEARIGAMAIKIAEGLGENTSDPYWDTFWEWPTSNLMGLVSVSNQEDLDRFAPWLVKTPLALRALSLEPLLGAVDLGLPGICPKDWGVGYADFGSMIDGIYIGCESGPRRRPCELAWVYDIVDQAKEYEIPVFVKQLPFNGKVSHNPEEWPAGLRIRELPEVMS